ncbi:MAG: hypothetical protein O2782_11520 [bacterium]|nr:hypothetical protein [bacterium]
MKTSPGLLFLTTLLVMFAAVLVGGQVWAFTGIVPLGIGMGLGSGGLLGVGARSLLKHLAPGRRQFLGEYQGDLTESDFGDVAQVVAETGPRGKIRHNVQERADRVAGSVRSLLIEGQKKKKKAR